MSVQERTRGWDKGNKEAIDYEYDNLVQIENKFHIKPWIDIGEREGYLYNIVPTTMNVTLSGQNKSQKKTGAHLYFVSDNNKTWRLTVFYRPYFYLKTRNIYKYEEVTKFLKKEMEKYNIEIDYIKKEDLSLFDHLNKKRSYLNNIFFRISFDTIENLTGARDFLVKLIEKNKKSSKEAGSSNNSNNKYLFNEDEFCSGNKADADNQQNEYSYSYDKWDDGSGLGNEKGIKKEDDINKSFGTGVNDKLNMNEVITNPKRKILTKEEVLAELVEIYEYDVKYITRFCIDKNVRCGLWYKVIRAENEIYTEKVSFQVLNKTVIAPLNILAWDIECYKDELKFPDKEKDEIILISYMYNAQGYLIVNRNVMSKNIREFLYRPNKEYSGAGSFKIFNEKNEHDLLKRFLDHIRLLKIHIFVTYNGDFFDIPYLYRRCEINNLKVAKEIGFIMNNKNECSCNFILNIDAYKWVERDSYLPNGSRTLKAVCKIKLKYNPTEVDPELMVPIARNDPQHLAVYSVSDAVATFYLYDKYIHNFLFALCSIIPMSPDDVLRQGSGTLCEQLLMAEAYQKNILFPNKYKPVYNQYFTDPANKKKYFIYEDSFVGGTVQSLKCGIYRNDLKEFFSLDVDTYKYLLNNIDSILDFWVEKDLNKNCRKGDPGYIMKSQIVNLNQIKEDVCKKLNFFIANPNINICPLIYHLDVAAMYPNIILSHRLQPNAIITPDHCFNCSFYKQRHICQKKMVWKRKLEIAPIDYGHVLSLKQDLKTRLFLPQKTFFQKKNNLESDSSDENNDEASSNKKKSWNELSEKQRHDELMKAIKEYSQRVFKKTKVAKETDTSSLVCQRENPFYVDTVRTFRDRRYVYKRGLKECEHEKRELLKQKKIDYMKIQELDDKILLNDSLQLAHKCILNSFYGYVKRRSSRWYSDQMGAIVTYTGSQIISGAFNLIDKIGIPMELDTDGIWCLLPQNFPEIYDVFILDAKALHLKNEYENKDENELKNDPNIKKVDFEFPTNILNYEMHKKWTNDQYLVYNEQTDDYECISKNEIFFELDGPWHGMFLPASEKSDELLKKRYVVFNDKYKISELKGFEIKRRGELRIIQKFQSEIFNHFLKGKTKEESYYYASLTANKWKNLIDTKAADIDNDDELFDLILARKVLNKSVKEQPNAKSLGITTAKRLSEFLNNSSYIEDNNVSTQFIVASKPAGADINLRAIPVQIFKAPLNAQVHYLSKWLDTKFPPNVAINVRDIIDWGYYKQKLETQILKLVIIPAIKQNINNPITSIPIPDWLKKQISMSEGKQKKITSFFVKKPKKEVEDSEQSSTTGAGVSDASTEANGINGIISTKKEQTQSSPSSTSHFREFMQKKKRAIEDYMLDNFIAKKKKIHQLADAYGTTSKTGYAKKGSFDFLEGNSILILDHKKVNISNLKMKDLQKYFENNFKNWLLINNRIWKNNRTQIKKIRLEEVEKRKRISKGGGGGAAADTNDSSNYQKISTLDQKYSHVIQNPMDIVYLYKKVKTKKTETSKKVRGKKKTETAPQTNAKGEKEVLLKPYLKYFKHETDSDSSDEETEVNKDAEMLDENDDDGIYYAIVSLKNKNKFYKIKLQIYRHIYINNYEHLDVKSTNNMSIKLICSKTEKEVFKTKAYANFFLPRNVKVFNLYEFIMTEKYFNQYIINTLNANYHESIISVYETRTPLYYDFLSRYGNSVEIDSNNYNVIFDNNKNFKSSCFSKIDKNKNKNDIQEYLDDIHIVHIHIFHTMTENICSRIFIQVFDQHEENEQTLFCGNQIMFSGVPNQDAFDPYEQFMQFIQLREAYEQIQVCKKKHPLLNNGTSTNINGGVINKATSGLNGTQGEQQEIQNTTTNNNSNNNDNTNIGSTGGTKEGNLYSSKPNAMYEAEKEKILNNVFKRENFIKNVPKDFLFLYHYRKFNVYHETDENVYKVFEFLDMYLNKYRSNIIMGKKKYIFYVSSTIDKKKLGWWSTNKYFPCFFKKLENPSQFQHVPAANYKTRIFELSLKHFYDNYHRIEEDLHLSRISNIPFFNLLHIEKKNKKHKFIYDVLYASFIRKYKGILWLSYLGNYDLGIPCLNINNFCDYDILKKNAEINNPGIYRGYIVHLFFNESLIFNSVRLFTKYSNLKSADDYTTFVKKKSSKRMFENYEKGAFNKYNKKQGVVNEEDANMEEDEEDNGFAANDADYSNGNNNNMNMKTSNKKKNLIQNKYDINLIVEQDSHVSQFSHHAFKLLGQSLEYLISKISTLSTLVTNKTFESISEIFTSFYSWISSNSSLLYDIALYNKVQECSEIYQNNLINVMKTKFNANIIYADLRNFVISFNEFSIISGRNILKSIINYFGDSESIYANVPFYIKQEYVAACQFDKYNYIRYKQYQNPTEENTDENLKVIEYLPPICESFLRYVLDIVTLNPLYDVIEEYSNLESGEKKKKKNILGYDETLNSTNGHVNGMEDEEEREQRRDKKEEEQIRINKKRKTVTDLNKFKDVVNFFNVVTKKDVLTDKVNLAQKAKLLYIFDKSFDELPEVVECCSLINESIDVLAYKVEEKLKELWFIPGIIYKKIKKAIKFKKYLIENYWPYDDDELDDHQLKIAPFLFPPTIGNLAKKESNWRLEIVKFCICLIQNDKILNLENENSNEAFDEKRHELFEIVGESEYSKINETWKSPCHELILKDIACSSCSAVYHMNVITSLVEAEINGKSSYIWLCKYCNAKYDTNFIELKILTLLQDTFDAYNAQDLICDNCKAIKSFHRRSTCKCGKVFTPRLDIANWVETLEIVENLANMLNMTLLLDVLESMKSHLI